MCESGDETSAVLDLMGSAIAVGFTRVLLGDHGPYLELEARHLARVEPALAHLRFHEKHKFFDLFCTVSGNRHATLYVTRPCNVRREGGQSLVFGALSLVISEGKACNPL